MATARVNGVRLFYDLHGGGAVPLVLVHGSWARLPRELKQTLIDNAPTFLDESKDPEQRVFDLEWVRDFSQPTGLTLGDQSPLIFEPVVENLVKAMPHAEVLTFPGAEHIPHVTHPDAYAEAHSCLCPQTLHIIARLGQSPLYYESLACKVVGRGNRR
ncbi:MAG: hypothetical protein OJF52_001080 [Nitrospira sp.]|jgi:pimeloyl-ACP methyl ester carboxylesterase|nr:MAG: hypothetical protein OJF52_001080 [Nitrospira sp.]